MGQASAAGMLVFNGPQRVVFGTPAAEAVATEAGRQAARRLLATAWWNCTSTTWRH